MNSDDPAYTVKSAGIDDVAGMLELEKTYFASCWHSEPSQVRKLMEKEPMMFRVCKVDDEVKGYYWVYPLGYDIWRKLVTGKITEAEMVSHIKSFSEPDLYLYIATVIVDQDDVMRKKYTKALVYDFGRNFVLSKNKYADIKGVGAFTISEGGRRLMERSSFSYQGSFAVGENLARTYIINQQTLFKHAVREQQKRKMQYIA